MNIAQRTALLTVGDRILDNLRPLMKMPWRWRIQSGSFNARRDDMTRGEDLRIADLILDRVRAVATMPAYWSLAPAVDATIWRLSFTPPVEDLGNHNLLSLASNWSGVCGFIRYTEAFYKANENRPMPGEERYAHPLEVEKELV